MGLTRVEIKFFGRSAFPLSTVSGFTLSVGMRDSDRALAAHNATPHGCRGVRDWHSNHVFLSGVGGCGCGRNRKVATVARLFSDAAADFVGR